MMGPGSALAGFTYFISGCVMHLLSLSKTKSHENNPNLARLYAITHCLLGFDLSGSFDEGW